MSQFGFTSRKGMSQAAFSGELTCPVCHSSAIRKIGTIGPYRIRYRCRKCGMAFQYETGRDVSTHPYAPFTKQAKFRDIVNDPKNLQGRKIF